VGSHSMLHANQLSPMVSQYNWDLYRVPLRRIENNYRIYVADFFTRDFDERTLPDEVKTKMAMILANPKQIMKDEDVSLLELMATPTEEGYREIGWRTSDTYFIVVLTYRTLCLLRGGIIDGETI
jgi:hypothetical protein